MPDLSRSRLKALIAAGHVTRAGATIKEPSHRVNANDTYHVALPPAEPAAPQAEEIPLTVVYEDGDLIVIDKQAGLTVHPAAGNWTGTLVNALIAHCGDSLSGIGGVRRPGIVHRIDKDTTGLMVVAKSDRAHQGLAAQFAAHGRDGLLERAYLALVWGVPERRTGIIETELGRSRSDPRKRAVVRAGGKEAITHYAVVETFGDMAALVECRLETGRTHQIRVHMAHIGHPLMGDPLYAKGFLSKASKLPEAARAALAELGRQALHAHVLGFEHPRSGELLTFKSDLPADMRALIDALPAG